MNSISLLSMDFTGVLLNVLAIIAIIIAGGFLIFFLGDLLLSVLDPTNNSIKDKKGRNIEQQPQPQILSTTKPQELTYEIKPEQQEVKPRVEYISTHQEVNMDKALEEEKFLNSKTQEQVVPVVFATSAPEPIKEERAQTPEEIFARLKDEERLYNESKINSVKPVSLFPESKPEPAEETFNFEDIFFTGENEEDDEDYENLFDDEDLDLTLTPEVKEEPIIEEVVEEPIAQEEIEEEPVVEEVDNTTAELELENASLKLQIENLLKERQLKEEELKVERAKSKEVVVKSSHTLTEEEYEERLLELKERLRYNEKELRSIKKEYIPLRKVRTTLERDKKKLRRREALVAKQKIILYGVNNIADIDADKAQKLEEDLDLLEGLRLSVQHCEEVIRNSEERYPVLETSFNILTRNIEQIKEDIQELETQKISKN